MEILQDILIVFCTPNFLLQVDLASAQPVRVPSEVASALGAEQPSVSSPVFLSVQLSHSQPILPAASN